MKIECEMGTGQVPQNDPSKIHGVKRRSILYDLPYFKVCNEPLSKIRMLQCNCSNIHCLLCCSTRFEEVTIEPW
jgi:hypothetical protein